MPRRGRELVTLADLQRLAIAAIAEHEALRARLENPANAHILPQHRANLLGEPPMWAHYVLSLGQPVRGALTRAQAEIQIGSARNIRAVGLRCLEIADEIEPVMQHVGGPHAT